MDGLDSGFFAPRQATQRQEGSIQAPNKGNAILDLPHGRFVQKILLRALYVVCSPKLNRRQTIRYS